VIGYVIGLAVSQASVYDVQSTRFAEFFSTRIRYTDASPPYYVAGIITAGPVPVILTWLVDGVANPRDVEGRRAAPPESLTALLARARDFRGDGDVSSLRVWLNQTQQDSLHAPGVGECVSVFDL
jgi:hypothetical protein